MTVALNTPPAQTYNLGPVQSWVEKAAYILGPMFNIKTIGGWRQSDPFPDHPSGHALDFMVNNPGTSQGFKEGDALAQYATAHYQELGIKYIIWNRQYWDPQQGWGPYTATTNPHTDHVHITFNDTPGSWTGANASGFLSGSNVNTIPIAFNTTTTTKDETCAFSLKLFPLGDPQCILTKVFVRELGGWLILVSGGIGIVIGIAIIAAFTFKSTSMLNVVKGFAPTGGGADVTGAIE